jgi:hypothetical protein
MRYRARIRDNKTGVETPVDPSLLSGAEGFFDSWKQSPDTPQEFRCEGWQNCDDEHPPQKGRPGYRVVYKTMRILTYPTLQLTWSNLRITISNGEVDRGGIKCGGSVRSRNADRRIIPEYGRVFGSAQGADYIKSPNMTYAFEAWQEDVKGISYVEIIYALDDSDPKTIADLMTIGRERTADLRCMLDLLFGPRMLAMPITEEIGEAFQDWHWNRRIHTASVSAESQANVRWNDGKQALADLERLLDRRSDLEETALHRLKLASQWYWMAEAELDRVMRFAYWWLAVEALEMETTHIGPVIARIVELSQRPDIRWKPFVGRLQGTRSKLLHGNSRTVLDTELRSVELLARLLLKSRLLGARDTSLCADLIELATS